MKTTKKVRFMSAGYFHTDNRYMYRYADEEGKMYDIFEDEVHRFLNSTGDDVYVSQNFFDIFTLREVGNYNHTTKRWDWVYN